jgi:hypothetical protein
MQTWLAKQKTDSVVAYTVNQLTTQADWETAHTVNADSGKVYKIVLLKSSDTFEDPTKMQRRYLTLVEQNGTQPDLFTSCLETRLT